MQRAHPESHPSVTSLIRRIRPFRAASQHALVERDGPPERPGPSAPMPATTSEAELRRAMPIASSLSVRSRLACVVNGPNALLMQSPHSLMGSLAIFLHLIEPSDGWAGTLGWYGSNGGPGRGLRRYVSCLRVKVRKVYHFVSLCITL